jgi:hypothetical protein
MKKGSIVFLLILICLTNFLFSEEIYVNGKRVRDDERDNQSFLGLTFSFSGFSEYRLGMGLFFLNTGRETGNDFGLMVEYNFEENIKHARLYYHMTSGEFSMILGGSTVLSFNDDDMDIGFAPEVGFSLSPLFQVFYRYNFYLNNKFNCHEIVFHLRKMRAVGKQKA